MKKFLSILLVLAMVLSCVLAAGAEEQTVTIEQLMTALNPTEITENGPFSFASVYANTGNEMIEGMVETRIYARNGEYCEMSQRALYASGAEQIWYVTSDPADPSLYFVYTGGASAQAITNEEAIEYTTQPFLDLTTAEITKVESSEDSTAVTLTVENGNSCVITLDSDGRVTDILLSYPSEEGEEPMTITVTFDYSEGITVDHSPKEANADYNPSARPEMTDHVTIATTDIYGNEVTDELIKDAKLVMVNLWEPWCGPCVGEMPDLQKLYENYKDKGLIILGVYTETSMNAEALKIVEEKGITYPILHSNESLLSLMQNYVPATFFLNSNGDILTPEPFGGAAEYEVWEARILDFLN